MRPLWLRCRVAEMAYQPRLEQKTLSDNKHALAFDWCRAAAANSVFVLRVRHLAEATPAQVVG